MRIEKDIWSLLGEEFDEKLPRRSAIMVKAEDEGLTYAYPARWGTPGFYFDMRHRSTYEEEPAFKIEMSEYTSPKLLGRAGGSLTSHIYKKQIYRPSFIERELVFTSAGLKCDETFSRTMTGAFTWRMDFKSLCLHYGLRKTVYLVVSGNSVFDSIMRRGDLIEIRGGEKTLTLCVPDMKYGVYNTTEEFLSDIGRDKLKTTGKHGRYVILACAMDLKAGEAKRFQMGISFGNKLLARKAAQRRDLSSAVMRRWNKWFVGLPAPEFETERECKAYYKCWWIVRLNYYRHPKLGHTVLEAFPVYRGYWLWGLTSSEWHSDQNTEHTSKFIRKVLDLFFNNQREDGYLAHAIYLEDKVPGEKWMGKGITQTPHIPWTCLRYYRVTGDKKSLKKWWPGLVRFYEYLNNTRDPENLHLWSITTSYDSGLDTTSAFDRVTYKNRKDSEDYCYPAIFAAERCRYEQAMAAISMAIGNGEEASWSEEARKTGRSLGKVLWDGRRKWFGVRHQDGTLDTRVGIDGLFAFSYGLATARQAASARKNFKSLIGNYGVYTVAPGENGFSEDTYWRGPAWAKSCSCAMSAARHYYRDLVPKVKQAMVNMLLAHPSVWECMNARTGEIARGDIGFCATPVICSNVGSGEAMAAFFTAAGIDAFSFDEELTVVPVRNFHWAGFRIDVKRVKSGCRIAARKAERSSGTMRLSMNRRKMDVDLKTGYARGLKA